MTDIEKITELVRIKCINSDNIAEAVNTLQETIDYCNVLLSGNNLAKLRNEELKEAEGSQT